MLPIHITKTKTPKPKPQGNLDFGKTFTDHMFLMDYTQDLGWQNPRIVPYDNLSLSPAAMVFHYGQESFEALKAYKNEDGSIYLFRPEMNARRLNQSNERLCIPTLPEETFVEAVSALVKLDAPWLPAAAGTSLYIRPFVIATEAFLGVTASNSYLFVIILSPCGPYYPSGQKPIGIWVEDSFVRAAPGGVGFAKTGGNYAASFVAGRRAQEAGYMQVLWLDGLERRYIEEAGFMNIFFKIAGRIITPALNGTILPGITRDSVISLCQKWGLPVEQRRISIDEIVTAHQSGTLEEVFGTGTAAIVAPIETIAYKNQALSIKDKGVSALSKHLYDTITAIQRGQLTDSFGWRVQVS